MLTTAIERNDMVSYKYLESLYEILERKSVEKFDGGGVSISKDMIVHIHTNHSGIHLTLDKCRDLHRILGELLQEEV